MSGVDAVTLGLAIFGSVGTVAQVYSTVRDRPRLRMELLTTDSVSKPPGLRVQVYNVGNRPTTVRKLGLFSHRSGVIIESETEGTMTGTAELGCTVAEGVFLDPGQGASFDLTLAEVMSTGAFADEPIRVYADDIGGRRVWGGAVPLIRAMIGPAINAANAPEEIAEWFAEPPPERLLPEQVEPVWKVWKKRELRNPSAWRSR